MGLLIGLISVAVVLIVIATAFPIVWPMVTSAGYNIVGSVSENITGMTSTDVGTTTIKGFWPLILLVVGIGIAIGLIVYGLKKFQIMSSD